MKNYKLINNVSGWIVFLIATITYVLTIEPTTSFWDCGEFIANAYKLEVGHPPGAPLFMILARFFSLFAMGDVMQVAKWINIMSALASSFTILFLFWTITHFSKQLVEKISSLTPASTLAIMASGVVGALAYTWSDSFWFSAVEGEVYALSSLFTAIVFWAILKWENVADQPYANRWLILIFYLIGLSVGVHLLNLLAIPAIVLVYYFKQYKVTRKGIIAVALISLVILGGVLFVIIPQSIALASYFELLFVNGFGLPIHSGAITFVILMGGLLAFGIVYTHKKGKAILNTIILSITVLVIGYSSFTMLVIRSNANPPMDENNPDNVFALLSYLNREQYGSSPLLYGQFYNAPIIDSEDKDSYIKVGDKYEPTPWVTEYKYDKRFETLLPRMWSNRKDQHISAYQTWGDIKGRKIKMPDYTGKQKVYTIPTFRENIKFMLDYQFNHMYFRYFLWNFVGRQNDIQGHGSFDKGNWLSGISFIDEARLGKQELLPDDLKHNKGRNTFYFMPLILGLIGLLFQFVKNVKQFWVTLLLFFMTGLAIILYLNSPPFEPRERDYAYALSFYAFAIWIGLGVLGLFFAPSKITFSDIKKMGMLGAGVGLASGLIALLFGAGTSFALLMIMLTGVSLLIIYLIKYLFKPIKNPMVAAALVFIIGLVVPVQMVGETWDDHDRSNRYTARDFARNYLESCAPNAILFTMGDNDTFPLWYVQEVEGFRTDVRVVNLSLLNTDWYIDQMKRKAYDSEPVPFSLTEEQYRANLRNVTPVIPRFKDYKDLKMLIDFVKSDNPAAKTRSPYQENQTINYFPANKFELAIDAEDMVKKGVVSKQDADQIVDKMRWTDDRNIITKNNLMVLDLIANNDWKRPIYFAITVGPEGYNKLEDYFQLEGLAYRLVPIKTPKQRNGLAGRINTEIMYDNLMNKFTWGGIDNPDVYLDENNLRMTSNIRSNFARLATELLKEGKRDKAMKALDHCLEVVPMDIVPAGFHMVSIVEAYYKAGEFAKAEPIIKAIQYQAENHLNYYFSLDKKFRDAAVNDIRINLYLLQSIYSLTKQYQQDELNKVLFDALIKYQEYIN